MTWQYRIVKHTHMNDNYVYYDIREVYRNGDKLSWSMTSTPPVGDTPDELKADLKMMLEAFDLPVLEKQGDTLVKVKE